MPPTDGPTRQKTLQDVVDLVDLYPIEAFEFVREGLGFTVESLHGKIQPDSTTSRHINGRQLCEGLREYALRRWGLLARTVLRRWGIDTTSDFGRIVFAMVENGLLQQTDDDTIEDFRNVYDFRTAFEYAYRIAAEPLEKTAEGRA